MRANPTFVENDYIKVLKKIGHEKGTQIQDSKDNILCDSEGIICKTLDKSINTLGMIKLEWVMRNGEKTLEVLKTKEIDDMGLGDVMAESEGMEST